MGIGGLQDRSVPAYQIMQECRGFSDVPVFDTDDEIAYPVPSAFGGVVNQIARYDTVTQKIKFIAKNLDGSVNPQGSFGPNVAISDNGRFVVYNSTEWANENDLGAGGLFSRDNDVFVRDMKSSKTTWVSSREDGTSGHLQGDHTSVGMVGISGDGRYVVFSSDQDRLVDGDFNGSEDVFVKDMYSGELHLISRAFDGGQHFSGIDELSISADGRFVTFLSDSKSLVPGDPNNFYDIFVVDLKKFGAFSKIVISDEIDGTITGTPFSDILKGNMGANEIIGDSGSDALRGSGGKDKLFGGSGDDLLLGGKGNDWLGGGNGVDVLVGGRGKDVLNGGNGRDSFVFGPNFGKDTIEDFQDDKDTIKLDTGLWSGSLNKQEVIDQFASVVDGDIVFDFGPQELTLKGFDNISELKDDISFI